MQLVRLMGNTHNGAPSYEGYRYDRRTSKLHRAVGGIVFIRINWKERFCRFFRTGSSFGPPTLGRPVSSSWPANETASASRPVGSNIAATAVARGLTVNTRVTNIFDAADLKVTDPRDVAR